jgi:tellurite resistance protein
MLMFAKTDENASDRVPGGFQVAELPKPGVFGRLFRQLPRQAAFVEIRNALATTPWHDIRESDVATTLERYKLTAAQAGTELADIYRQAVTIVAADHAISEQERAGLARLRDAFGLDITRSQGILEDVARSLYRETLVEALADGSISPAEKQRLEQIASNLSLPPDTASKVYAEEAVKAIQLYFDHATSDQRFSADEEARLNEMSA